MEKGRMGNLERKAVDEEEKEITMSRKGSHT